jgi:peptidyl-prolyl cis-trans isomerase C
MEMQVRQELLSDEALKRGLDRVPEINKRLEIWRQYYLALLMKDFVKRSVSANDAEVYGYLEAKGKLPRVPRVQIRELRTGNLDEMKQALDEMEKGKSFEEVIRRWSVDSTARMNGGVSELFPITEHQPIGELAWEMEVGQRFGPFAIPEGAYYFELLAKKTETAPDDTSAIAERREGRKELLRMKQKKMMDLYLSQVAETRGYTIYEERFNKLAVSPIPMMTFRILGFGGRMFEVPFVDKQIEWLNVEPPGQKILP